MLNKILLPLFISSFFLCSCSKDPTLANEENFTFAIDSFLLKDEVRIIAPGILVDESKKLFAIEDPHAEVNSKKQYQVKDVRTLDVLISYAKVFSKAGGLTMKEGQFSQNILFGLGKTYSYGYLIEFNEALSKDLSYAPLLGFPIVKAGNLCVDKIKKFTSLAKEEGRNVSYVTFSKKVCNLTEGINDEVIKHSGILDALGEDTTYKLVQNNKGWDVLEDDKIIDLDFVNYFLKYNF